MSSASSSMAATPGSGRRSNVEQMAVTATDITEIIALAFAVTRPRRVTTPRSSSASAHSSASGQVAHSSALRRPYEPFWAPWGALSPGRRLWQACCAAWNCGLFGLRSLLGALLIPVMLMWTARPLELTWGSGKSEIPWLRMHCENSSAC